MGVLELGARQQAATAKWAKWALGTAAAVLHPPSVVLARWSCFLLGPRSYPPIVPGNKKITDCNGGSMDLASLNGGSIYSPFPQT